LVEGTRLPVVFEARLVLGDAVRQLVADDIDTRGEIAKDDAVSIAVHHLAAVPERVVESNAEMDGRIEPEAAVVNGRTAVNRLVEAERVAGAVERALDDFVAARRVSFLTNERTGQSGRMVRVVNGAPFGPRWYAEMVRAEQHALCAQPLRQSEGFAGTL